MHKIYASKKRKKEKRRSCKKPGIQKQTLVIKNKKIKMGVVGVGGGGGRDSNGSENGEMEAGCFSACTVAHIQKLSTETATAINASTSKIYFDTCFQPQSLLISPFHV